MSITIKMLSTKNSIVTFGKVKSFIVLPQVQKYLLG